MTPAAPSLPEKKGQCRDYQKIVWAEDTQRLKLAAASNIVSINNIS